MIEMAFALPFGAEDSMVAINFVNAQIDVDENRFPFTSEHDKMSFQRALFEAKLLHEKNGKLDLTQLLVVYIGGHTPVKIFFRLRLQNLFPGVYPPIVVKGRWLAVVLCCVCLRVEVRVSMSARCFEGNGYGFNVGELF